MRHGKLQRIAARPPLRTIAELAEEFGVTAPVLGRMMAADPAGPRPALDGRSGNALRTTWYNPREARRWWVSLHPPKGTP